MLKESDELVIFGVTFDSKIIFEKHLCLISWAASQRLCIIGKSWQVFHGRSLREMLSGYCPACFGVLFCSMMLGCWHTTINYWSVQSVGQGCPVPNWGVFECDIDHHRSVAVLCVPYKIWCNPMHPLNDCYMDRMCPACTLVYLCAALLQNRPVPQDFCSLLCVSLEQSCWPHIQWCRTSLFQEQGQCFFIDLSCSVLTVLFHYFSVSLSVNRLVLCSWGLWTALSAL